jgi:hypothetical protein
VSDVHLKRMDPSEQRIAVEKHFSFLINLNGRMNKKYFAVAHKTHLKITNKRAYES